MWVAAITLQNRAYAANTCTLYEQNYYAEALKAPHSEQMSTTAPESFAILFGTNFYGGITATCERSRAPVWVDRIYNLVVNGYYDDNYFFRVIDSDNLHIVQFGTGGNPDTSAPYNFAGSACSVRGLGAAGCGILLPQPNAMPVGAPALSNTFGTLSMSTSVSLARFR